MKLILDFGNTHHKVAVFDQDQLVCLKRFETAQKDDLQTLWREYELTDAILSSVDQHDPALEDWLITRLNTIILTEKTPLPIRLQYRTPHSLGKDRIAAAAGAFSSFPDSNVLVIDAGTCVTYEIIDDQGNYLGGAISPGLTMRLQSMHNFTSKLPLISIERPPDLQPIPVTGQSTEDCIRSGAYHGLLMEIDGVISHYKRELIRLKVILTGGDGKYFESTLKNEIFAVPNLVLQGLNKILDYNALREK